MSQMLKSSGAMGAATLLSRILGMAREVLYANFMGAGLVAGAFKLAFMIPNLFRRLLGEGALTAAFIPIFKDKEKNEGEAEMWRAANAVICGLVLAASAIIALVVIAISLLLAFDARSPSTAGRTSVEGGHIVRMASADSPRPDNPDEQLRQALESFQQRHAVANPSGSEIVRTSFP